jgi:hypothetical protein
MLVFNCSKKQSMKKSNDRWNSSLKEAMTACIQRRRQCLTTFSWVGISKRRFCGRYRRQHAAVTMDQEYKVIITVELRLLRVAALLRAAA